MGIKLHFERSETCAVAHNLPDGRVKTIDLDTTDGPWVQLTYEAIRTQDGATIAFIDDESMAWYLDNDTSEPFSDVVIEFVPEAVSTPTGGSTKRLERLLKKAALAALGDSNDREIDLLNEALGEAMELLGVKDVVLTEDEIERASC